MALVKLDAMRMMSPAVPADRLGVDGDDHLSTSRCRCGGGARIA